MRELHDRHALITGAASGIGRAIAIQLARRGVNLCLVDVNAAALEPLADDVRACGVDVMTLTCDLTQPAQISACVKQAVDTWPALALLINNAGVCYYGSTRRMTDEQWQRVIDVNLHAPAQLIRELLPTLETQDEAHIVNICSMFGLVSFRRAAAYQTSKFALVGLSEALRAEYAGSGLGVSAICPGFVRGTAFFDATDRPAGRKPHAPPPPWLCCSADTVAKRAVSAIRRNRAIVVITPLAKLLWWSKRLAPWLLDGIQQLGWGAAARRKRRR